ncbi:MAG: FAD-dependent oxidoreductase [Nitrosomonadales bacterium]|nr:FAD-dependent oxidoreductase [Nitrosomonadales bacterium]
MSNHQKLQVAVIGGGYAGMAAAVTLAERGVPVTVFESAKQLGGRARGVWHDDTQMDNGQHILLGCYHHTLRLIEQVGGNIERDFLRLPLQLTLYNRFELKAARLPAPLHLFSGLLTAQGLSLAQRLSAARFMLAMRRINFTLSHDMTVLDLLRAHNQDKELVRLLWEPLCISALNTPIHKASAQVLLHVLRDSLSGARGDSDMLLPRLNFSMLFPERAAEYVRQRGGTVLTSCGVEAIVPQDDGIELVTAQGAMRFSHVICAASPTTAARLFRAVPQLAPIAEQIETIPFQPIYTVYLQYPAMVRLPHSMFGFDRCFTQWLFDKGQIAGQHGLIAAVISAEGLHQELEHEQLAQKVAQELREQLDITAAPLWHRVIAEKRATFSCEPNLHRPAHITPLASVLLAGDYTAGDYPATLEGAVMSGLCCAGEIIPPEQPRTK